MLSKKRFIILTSVMTLLTLSACTTKSYKITETSQSSDKSTVISSKSTTNTSTSDVQTNDETKTFTQDSTEPKEPSKTDDQTNSESETNTQTTMVISEPSIEVKDDETTIRHSDGSIETFSYKKAEPKE